MKKNRRLERKQASYEGRLQAELKRAFERSRNRMNLDALTRAIANKSVKLAMKLITEDVLEDALTPAGRIIFDAFMEGGKIGAKEVR